MTSTISILHGDKPCSKSPFSIILELEVLVQDGLALAVEVDEVLDVRFSDERDELPKTEADMKSSVTLGAKVCVVELGK